MAYSTTLNLAMALMAIDSITPADKGCQEILQQHLDAAGFAVHNLPSGPVDNLWAIYGDNGPLLVFAGHTDVVPTGELTQWQNPPFQPAIIDGILHGRGAQDMKGAVAAMTTAVERFVANHPHFPGRIALLITSGEEGQDYHHGTPKVLQYLQAQNDKIDWCIVGEPSSQKTVGDMIRNGRRGSLKAFLTLVGKQGHVAYPDLAENPVHQATAFLHELVNIQWCKGNEFFPPTVMQCAFAKTSTETINIIPAELKLGLAFRYASSLNAETIQKRLVDLLAKHQLEYRLDWELSGLPFLTDKGALLDAVKTVIQQETGLETLLSTSGGTSDGRFIAPTGAEVIELGSCNDTIHKINESVDAEELNTLSTLYERICEQLFCRNH